MYIITREAAFASAVTNGNYITLLIHEVWNSAQTKMLAAFHNEFTARCYLNARADHHDRHVVYLHVRNLLASEPNEGRRHRTMPRAHAASPHA